MADDTHETKIVISGDANGATNALSRVMSSLKGVRNAVTGVMKTLGMINWAVQAVQMMIDGYKKLTEWVHRAETEAKRLREELAKTNYESSVINAAEAYKKLNKELAETLRLEKDRQAIARQRKNTSRDLEDARAEQNKQLEIAALDPNDPEYDQKKKAIANKYARKQSSTAAARAGEDNRERMNSLLGEAALKDKEAQRLQNESDRAWKIVDTATEAKWRTGMDLRSAEKSGKGVEEAKRKDDEAQAALNKAYDFAAGIDEQKKKTEAEADRLRRDSAELMGGGSAAKIRDSARQQQLTNEENEEKAKAAREAAKAEEDARKKEADDKARAAKERTNAENAAKLDKARDLNSFAERLAAQEGVSTNRLSAMGLGSGVQGGSGVASDVKKLVTLLEEEVRATKENKPGDAAAVYGD